jgi:hypothetical protein
VDAPAAIRSARVRFVRVGNRDRARLEGAIDNAVPHRSLDVDVLLRDRSDRHLMTLSAGVVPDATGTLVAEWPLFKEVMWSAERAFVIVRGGQPRSGQAWRLAPKQVRALVDGRP